MRLRSERSTDHGRVRDLHLAAFGESHGQVVAALVDDLRPTLAAPTGLALVAEDDDAVVGHVVFSRSLLDAPDRLVEVAVLSPLAVRPDRQQQGIGARLVRHGLQVLTRAGVPAVFVEGDPAYYRRFGFRPGTELRFRRPSLRTPEAAFQALRLPAHESWMTGTLVFAETFWRHDAVGLRDPKPR